MYSKIINLLEYFKVNYKENRHLVAVILLKASILTNFIYYYYLSFLNRSKVLLHTSFIIYFFLFPLILVFIRPVDQFIYFQF